MITDAQLKKLNIDPSWVVVLNPYLEKYEINTPLRISHFISQCAHESGNFKILKENLNYSQQGLRKVFPKYFPDDATAFRYARQPAAIANRVYAGRMGNGAESSGDGWKYSGKGLIQLTGRENFTKCSRFLFGDDRFVSDTSWFETKGGAVASAVWFWTANSLNKIADSDNVVLMTKRINGGNIGLLERTELLHKCKEVFGA